MILKCKAVVKRFTNIPRTLAKSITECELTFFYPNSYNIMSQTYYCKMLPAVFGLIHFCSSMERPCSCFHVPPKRQQDMLLLHGLRHFVSADPYFLSVSPRSCPSTSKSLHSLVSLSLTCPGHCFVCLISSLCIIDLALSCFGKECCHIPLRMKGCRGGCMWRRVSQCWERLTLAWRDFFYFCVML